MIASIELQVISAIITSEDDDLVKELLSFDETFYSVFKPQIRFILGHYDKFNDTPDVFTFQSEFPDITLVAVSETKEFLTSELRKNKQHIILLETFNKLKDLGSGDVREAWQYIGNQFELASSLDDAKLLNIIKDSEERAQIVKDYAKQTRIPTGFKEIDNILYGGLSTVEELFLIVARTNNGKAQPLWSKVLTPTGWKRMGDIRVGDEVVGKDNDNGRVVQIFPQGTKKYYRVHFNDNTDVECCDDHLWEVLPGCRRERANIHYGEHEVLSLRDIRHSLSNNYSVDISKPIHFYNTFLSADNLDPYLLGVILGDGGIRDDAISISNESELIWNKISSALVTCRCKRSGKYNNYISGVSYDDNFVRQKLIEYGLMGVKSEDKFIPYSYLTAPIEVRKALLAGLVDTDGYISNTNSQSWEFDTSSDKLADSFEELARSLGVKVIRHPRKPSYYVTSDGVRHEGVGIVHFSCRSEFNPFTLPAKSSRFTISPQTQLKRHCKKIISVEYIGETECQCILLDNKSHTYITDNYTVTHNTWVCTKMMETAQANGFPVLYYSPEMQGAYLATRFDTWRNHFENSNLYLGRYDEHYTNYLKALSDQKTDAFILEDKDAPGNTVNVPFLENLVRKHHIKLLIIDGLSYLEDVKRSGTDTDYIKYKNLCLDLFKLSKMYGCAVVVAAQANRASLQEKDDKGECFPTLANLEGSDHPGRICTQAMSIRQIFDKHVLDVRLEKSRTANNQKPVFSYSWDVNTGNMQYIPGDDGTAQPQTFTQPAAQPKVISNKANDIELSDDDDDDEDVEF